MDSWDSPTIKTILVGNSSVGKTCLHNAFFDQTFGDYLSPTIAPTETTKTVDLPDGTKVNLIIWDTAGQERFQSLAQNFYRGASVALLCYDLSAEIDCIKWINRIRENNLDAKIYLVLTKADTCTPDELVESRARGMQLIESHNLEKYMQTSAKTSYGINDLLMEIAMVAHSNFEQHPHGVQIDSSKETEDSTTSKKKCC